MCRPGEPLRLASQSWCPSPQDIIAITQQVAVEIALVMSQTVNKQQVEWVKERIMRAAHFRAGPGEVVVPAAALASAGWGRPKAD